VCRKSNKVQLNSAKLNEDRDTLETVLVKMASQRGRNWAMGRAVIFVIMVLARAGLGVGAVLQLTDSLV
jgi:hypothetical protein